MKLTDHNFPCSSLTNFEYGGHAMTGNLKFYISAQISPEKSQEGKLFLAGFLNFESPCDGAQRHSLFEKAHYKCVKVYRGKTASFSARSFCTYVSSLDSWGLLGQVARVFTTELPNIELVRYYLVGMPIPRRFSFLGDRGNWNLFPGVRGISGSILFQIWIQFEISFLNQNNNTTWGSLGSLWHPHGH